MTDKEQELIALIRNHPNPGEALAVAFNIITNFLTDAAVTPDSERDKRVL